MSRTIDGIIYTDDLSTVTGTESKDITKAVVADGARTIGINAFSGCAKLEEISLPSTICNVQMRAFKNCASLLKVHLADDMTDLSAEWFKALPDEFEFICSPESETFRTIKRSTRLKAHVKSIALSDAKSEKIKKLQSAGLDAVLSAALAQAKGAFHCILSSRKTATTALIQIGRNCGSFRFGMDSEKWLPKIPKIIEILGDQQKDGAEIYSELKANKITLADLSSGRWIRMNADERGDLNLFTGGTLNGTLRISGGGALSIFGARRIGSNAADSLRDFESIVLNEGVETIEANAFMYCERLGSIVIPEGVREIGYHAFDGCTSLQSVTLPESIEAIRMGAFRLCMSLSSIQIPRTIKVIENYAFQFTGIKNLGETLPVKTDDGGTREFTIRDGLATAGGTLLYATTPRPEIVVPEGVSEIGKGAFEQCRFLTRIVLPKSARKIGAGAFAGCTYLTEISIPDTIEEIESLAFDDTGILSLGKTYRVKSPKIRGDGGHVDFTIRDGMAMEGDTLAYVACRALNSPHQPETLVIPDFVRKIGFLGFSCENITRLIIPASVEAIAFTYKFAEKVGQIEYGGTLAQWRAIEKTQPWHAEGKTVKCTDGEEEMQGA